MQFYGGTEMAEADPSLREQQPYKASYEQDFAWLGAAMVKHYHGDDSDMRLLAANPVASTATSRHPAPGPVTPSW